MKIQHRYYTFLKLFWIRLVYLDSMQRLGMVIITEVALPGILVRSESVT